MKIFTCIVCISLFIIGNYVNCDEEDLYDILGVRRSSNSIEIKKAYKKLARLWHPDKNRDKSAQDKFIKINEAYETLGDDKRRSDYDNYGHRTGRENQEQHTGFDGFHFNFGSKQSSLHKQRISLNHYETSILPNSKTRPFIIFAHSSYCFQCMRIEPIWDRFVKDLEQLGLGIGTLQAQLDHALSRRLRVSSVPAIIAVVDGQHIWFDIDGPVNLQTLRDFIREQVFPKDLITTITTPEELDTFLSSYRRDNRVRIVHYAERPRASQRYIAASFCHRANIAAAYVDLKSPSMRKLLKRYPVSYGRETLLIFNEEYATPIKHVMEHQISRSMFDEVLLAHSLLLLPRLSHQDMFDEACPVQVNSKSKRICVVLFSSDETRHDTARKEFRLFHQHLKEERVRFVYIYERFQRQFSDALNLHRPIMNNTLDSLRVAILWRTTPKRVHYEWLEDGWLSNATLDPAKHQHQRTTLAMLLKGILNRKTSDSGFTVTLDNPLVDEHQEYLFRRIYNKIFSWFDHYKGEILHMDMFTMITLTFSVALMCCMLYFASLYIGTEYQDYSRKQKGQNSKSRNGTGDNNISPASNTVYVHPLARCSFSSLVLNSESGVRLIVVLVNDASKTDILTRFARIVYQFDSGKGGKLKFAFLDLDDHLEWYKSLLAKISTISEADLNKLTSQNCIGTVLCLNGARKYISMYYPRKWRSNIEKHTLMSQVIGFVESSDEEFSEGVSSVADVLKGLSAWLERLYEGSLKRYKLEQWPLPTV